MKLAYERKKTVSRTNSQGMLTCSHGIEEEPAKEKIEKLKWVENQEEWH